MLKIFFEIVCVVNGSSSGWNVFILGGYDIDFFILSVEMVVRNYKCVFDVEIKDVFWNRFLVMYFFLRVVCMFFLIVWLCWGILS